MQRIAGIDMLRGIAVLFVLISHVWTGTFSSLNRLRWEGMLPDLSLTEGVGFKYLSYIVSNGWFGVSLFFALSGFCIHLGYLHSKDRFTTIGFYLRRFFRLYPTYLFVLVAFVILFGQLAFFKDVSWYNFSMHAAMIFNFDPDTYRTLNPSFWTLAIEAQLYLIYPIALWWRSRFGMTSALKLAFIVEATALLFVNAAVWATGEYGADSILIMRTPLVFWFDWMIGAYIAERFYNGARPVPRSFLITFAILAPLAIVIRPLEPFRYVIGAVLGALLIDRVVRSSRDYLVGSSRWLVYAGVMSYSLYVWHQPLISYAISSWSKATRVTDDGMQLMVGVLSLIPILGLSWLSYKFLELPGIRLGKKVEKAVVRVSS